MEGDVKRTPDEQHQQLVQWFEDAEQSTYDARLESERDRDYYDGRQWTAEQMQVLRKRKQPPITINRVRPKIEWLKGLEVRQRTDPRAFPRTPEAIDGAEAATDALRFVADNTDWDTIRSKVWENMLVEGFGGVEIAHQQGKDGAEVAVNWYSWDRLFYDPHSKEPDFSDARYKGAVVWMDKDDVIARFPGKEGAIEATFSETAGSETYDDRPHHSLWADTTRRRVRVVAMYYREGGKWYWCAFTRGGKLADGESPYVDEDGRSVCPLHLMSAYVDRDNSRYGVIRDMVGPQDEVNHRRSKSLHLLSNRQTLGQKGAVDSVSEMKRELSRGDGHVEINGDMRFEMLTTTDLSSGQFQLLQEAKSELDLMGANSALGGEVSNQTSGRAVQARQQGGLIEIASLQDNLHQFTKTAYRHMWMIVRQFWDTERWVRVTDDERNVRFVGLNQPMTLADQLRQMPDEQVLQIARQMGLRPNDPRLGQVVGIQNPVAEMDVDITIEEAEDQISLQGETFEQLVNLASSMPGSVPPEILIEQAPGMKREVKDKLMEHLQAQAQAAGPVQALEAERVQADISKAKASAMKDVASAAEMQADAALGVA